MEYNPGFNIDVDTNNMEFIYGKDVFGPTSEKRKLEDVRQTLKDYNSKGPEILYSIAMDTGKEAHIKDLQKRNLLYGMCIYASGQIGEEPIRSQGHIHAISPSCNYSTPEMYEILQGEAYIFMQKGANSETKEAYAILCKARDKILVPPGYAHYTVNANPHEPMVFGAWCVRDYGFDYRDVRKMGGLSYFPIINEKEEITFEPNETYGKTKLIIKEPREYIEFNVKKDIPIYEQYEIEPARFDFVTEPQRYMELWEEFTP